MINGNNYSMGYDIFNRQYTTKNTQCIVMFGAMVVCCMKFGAWDTNHLKK